MNNLIYIALAFLLGLGGGWFAKSWFETNQLKLGTVAIGGKQSADTGEQVITTNSHQALQTEKTHSNLNISNTSSNIAQNDSQISVEDIANTPIFERFDKFLSNRQYFEAMNLFQEQKQLTEPIAGQLRVSLLKELKFLIETRANAAFSELVENYLSIYYDDIDVLLLLAEFNQANSSYLEVVNVFLLAKTYAYSESDQDKVASKFDNFVMEVDGSYSSQKNWWSLINLYAHIDTSGLMTSTYRFRQAVAHLRSGDETYAVEQFNQLLNDSLVGDAAAKALSSLSSDTEAPTVVFNSSWEGADSIALQKIGNQYAVSVENSKKDSVKLLIDTGASMTAMSKDAFDTLNVNGEAEVQDRRVFRTANGLVQATVYSIPELSFGPYRLENTQIAVIDFDNNRGIEGLLGMNILGQFRFQIDQDGSQLLLSEK